MEYFIVYLIFGIIFFVIGFGCAAAYYTRRITIMTRENLARGIKRYRSGFDRGVSHGRNMQRFYRDTSRLDSPFLRSKEKVTEINPRPAPKDKRWLFNEED